MSKAPSTIWQRMWWGIAQELDMYLHLPLPWKLLGILFFGATIFIIVIRSIGLTLRFIYDECMYAIGK